jgi:HlyD family secretion protein
MTRPTATEVPAPVENPTGIKSLVQSNGQNGAAHAVPTRVPKTERWSTRRRVLTISGILLAVAALSGGYLLIANPFHRVHADLVTHKVHYERLELTITERAALESAKNSDIYCTVKASQKGGTVASTIKWLIDDGSVVKKGDRLIDLDDSGLQDQLKNERITLDKNESDKIEAEENYNIQLSQNESDIKTAEVNLQLARIDLQKYREGDYPQALKDVEGRIKIAEGDLEQQRDRTAWANRMVKKGYYTVTQAQAEQSKLESYELALAKVAEEKRVLTEPNYGKKKRDETDFQNKVAEAERALERVKIQAKAKDVSFKGKREAAKSVYGQQQARCKEIEDEIKKCKIFAPQDGMVVYYVPEQARGGGGAQQAIIAQGEPVREGQKLMQIPDLRQMMANTKIHEALVARVHAGQPAQVRVDAFPDRLLNAHVEMVATISSQQDFWAPDVKVYTTKVKIDDPMMGLKPGMSAGVKIVVADALENVLTVPLQAIIGSAEMGKQRKCFVLTPHGPEERTIVVGQSNDKMAEVREGLHEGEDVVENPQALLGDKAKTRQAQGKGKNDADSAADEPAKGEKKRPAAGPNGMPGAGPGGEGKMQRSPEEIQKRMQEKIDKYRKASPEERKQMFQQEKPEYRDKIKGMLESQGIMVE